LPFQNAMTHETHNLAPTPAPQGEVMIERAVTFRNSTFGALKSFIRIHKRKHGALLSNAAAVDHILREWFLRNLPRDAVQTMLEDSRPASLRALHGMHQDDSEDPQEESTRRQPSISMTIPRIEFQGPRRPIINIEVRKFRSVPVTPAAC